MKCHPLNAEELTDIFFLHTIGVVQMDNRTAQLLVNVRQ